MSATNSTQPVSEVVGVELPADQAVREDVPEVPDTALMTQDDDHEGDQTPYRSSQTAAPVNSHHIQE
jgi:hypothetical protein